MAWEIIKNHLEKNTTTLEQIDDYFYGWKTKREWSKRMKENKDTPYSRRYHLGEETVWIRKYDDGRIDLLLLER